MSLIPALLEPHAFESRDLVGGHPVLDFVNTVTGRDQSPRDWLPDYAAYATWLARSSGFPALDPEQLAARARAEPAAAARALAEARRLREALFGIFSAFARSTPVDPAAVEVLERSWKRAMGELRLVATATRLRLSDPADTPHLHRPTHWIALDAVKLLEDLPGQRLRICAGPNCSWLFIDRSKAGRRKWCDMTTCGNAAKARRHYRAASPSRET